jgi:hypothetical protein
VSFHKSIEPIGVLIDELLERLPGALDNLELVERLKLTDEVDHLGVDDPAVMPFFARIYITSRSK